MRVLTRDFYSWDRSRELRIVPIGDVHLGAAACDEKLFQKTINYIKDTPDTYWIGLGDYCDWINRKDPRFDVTQLADWLITKSGLADISKHQAARFLEMVDPISKKCLGLLCGNHETAISKHYERDVFSEIVTGIKDSAGFSDEMQLGIGYYGWMRLNFYRGKDGVKENSSSITLNLHHGFTGGKLAGAKALDVQRWLWTHDADLVLLGHSHNQAIQPEAVEGIDRNGNHTNTVRKGAFCGSYLKRVNEDGPATYAEVKGYLPLPVGGIEVILRPGAHEQADRVKILG